MKVMKNINGWVKRGDGVGHAVCDNNMLLIKLNDTTKMEIINIKVLCEEFLEVMEYEVFIDGRWFVRISLNRKTKEQDIKYNDDFMNQYRLEE